MKKWMTWISLAVFASAYGTGCAESMQKDDNEGSEPAVLELSEPDGDPVLLGTSNPLVARGVTDDLVFVVGSELGRLRADGSLELQPLEKGPNVAGLRNLDSGQLALCLEEKHEITLQTDSGDASTARSLGSIPDRCEDYDPEEGTACWSDAGACEVFEGEDGTLTAAVEHHFGVDDAPQSTVYLGGGGADELTRLESTYDEVPPARSLLGFGWGGEPVVVHGGNDVVRYVTADGEQGVLYDRGGNPLVAAGNEHSALVISSSDGIDVYDDTEGLTVDDPIRTYPAAKNVDATVLGSSIVVVRQEELGEPFEIDAGGETLSYEAGSDQVHLEGIAASTGRIHLIFRDWNAQSEVLEYFIQTFDVATE